MTPITRILVPVDLRAGSLEVANYAVSLAARLGSELVFVHALQNGWPLEPAQRKIRDGINTKSCGHRFLFCEGEPVAAILQAAESEKCDLILMPTRGRPALVRLFDGSITAQVLRRAKCPVWVGLDGLLPSATKPLRTVLCGLSLAPSGQAVLRWSASLAMQFNARLSLVHSSKALEAKPGIPCDQEWRSWLRRIARDEIRGLQTAAGTRAEVWLSPGRAASVIPPLAGCLGADLVVLGKSPEKCFLGDLRTLSYEIALRAPCPVASV
jgi:nucleotide-binding universal stress UspA family protein